MSRRAVTWPSVPRLAAAVLILGLPGCVDEAGRKPPAPVPAASRDTAGAAPAAYSFAGPPDVSFSLPPALREISGITFLPGGRLFAHDDERGTVYEIDTALGGIRKRFDLGGRRLRGDFEDIAAAGDALWMADSRGDLFTFPEGPDGGRIGFTKHPTGLDARNDVEGLCYDPPTGSLLLACKGHPGVDSLRTRAVYSFDLATLTLSPRPRFLLDLDALERRFGTKDFRPSGIARHPRTGNFFLLSSVGNTILELSPEGDVVGCSGLPKKHHAQPEGIAFDARGRLFISNEGPDHGTIRVYSPPEAR